MLGRNPDQVIVEPNNPLAAMRMADSIHFTLERVDAERLLRAVEAHRAAFARASAKGEPYKPLGNYTAYEFQQLTDNLEQLKGKPKVFWEVPPAMVESLPVGEDVSVMEMGDR